MFGKRLPGQPLGFKGCDGRRPIGCDVSCKIAPGRVALKIFELQLHLIEQAAGALSAGSVLITPQLGDL